MNNGVKPKKKPNTVREILELVFNKGYGHGITEGKSRHGETPTVDQAKREIEALMPRRLSVLQIKDIANTSCMDCTQERELCYITCSIIATRIFKAQEEKR